ncbi:hypothetical protein CMI47_12910 [Candidatus Pacearchaeota archaeon]|nr:hypothetical protein [Candidatus Pacearchaeota archaeon]|tara:strand:+ start:38686 stop:40380 length:1695 start_codon:yes stop_codon:yes gene_type:complete
MSEQQIQKSTKTLKAERKARMQRLVNIWKSFSDRQIVLAMRSINVLNIQWDKRIPTACVGFMPGITKPIFKFNPLFFDVLSDEEIAFVIAHETSHMVLKHLLRLKSNEEYKKKWRAFNVAADCIINDWLDEENYPEGPWFYGKKYFCDKCNGYGCGDLLDKCDGKKCKSCGGIGCRSLNTCSGIDCSDRTLHEVFKWTLKRFEEQQQQPGDGENNEPCDGGENCPHKSKNDSNDQQSTPCPNAHSGMGGEMVDDHSNWKNADQKTVSDWVDKNVSNEFKDKLKNKVESEDKENSKDEEESLNENKEEEDDNIRTSDTDSFTDSQIETGSDNGGVKPKFYTTADHIVGAGSIFDVNKLSNVRANWRAILEDGKATKEKLKFTWRRQPAVLMGYDTQYRLPHEEGEPQLRILVALDVSGSVSSEDKKLFFACYRGIPRNMFDVKTVAFANRCAEVSLNRSTNEIKHGHVGYGTEFSSICDWIRENNYNPDKIVVITDGGSSWRYRVDNPQDWNFVIRCQYYEHKDGTVNIDKLISAWGSYGTTKNNDWKKAKYFGFSKFARILGGV